MHPGMQLRLRLPRLWRPRTRQLPTQQTWLQQRVMTVPMGRTLRMPCSTSNTT